MFGEFEVFLGLSIHWTVYEGDEGWEMVRLHSFNDSSQREELCNSGAIWSEAVLVKYPQL